MLLSHRYRYPVDESKAMPNRIPGERRWHGEEPPSTTPGALFSAHVPLDFGQTGVFNPGTTAVLGRTILCCGGCPAMILTVGGTFNGIPGFSLLDASSIPHSTV